MQLFHFGTFWLRLSGNILPSLFLHVHVNFPGLAVPIQGLGEPPDWSVFAKRRKSIEMISDSGYALLEISADDFSTKAPLHNRFRHRLRLLPAEASCLPLGHAFFDKSI